MLENDHAIDHELHEAVTVVCFGPTDLLREDARQPRLRKPVADTIELSTLRDRVIEESQQHVDPVEDDARRLNFVGFRLEHGKHADQVEFPSLHDIRREVRIQEEELLPFECGKIPSEGGCVGDDLARILFECDEQACLLVPNGSVDERLKRKDRLSAARSSHHEGASLTRQATVGDLVESDDTRGYLHH